MATNLGQLPKIITLYKNLYLNHLQYSHYIKTEMSKLNFNYVKKREISFSDA